MKKRLLSSAGVLLFTFANVLVATLLLISPQTASAARATDVDRGNFEKIRRLYFLRDCVSYQLDDTGRDNDENDENIEFERYTELFKQNGDRASIGVGVATDDGTYSCATVGRIGMAAFDGSGTADAENKLMQAIWGKSIADNGGNAIPVGDDKDLTPAEVRTNRDAFVGRLNTKITELKGAIGAQAMREMVISSFAPLMAKCYTVTTTTPTDANWDRKEGSFRYTATSSNPSVTYYAASKGLDWSEVGPYVRSVGRTATANDSLYVGNAPIGREWSWDAFDTGWFPVGNDIMFSLGVGTENGGSVLVYGQDEDLQPDMAIMNCKYISQYKSFFFFDGDPNEVGYAVEGGALVLAVDTDGDGRATNEEETAAPPGAPGLAPATPVKSCESEGGALAWIFCPVLQFVDDQIATLDNFIQNILEVPPGDFADGSDLHEGWKVMRGIAYLILVPIMLVMVLGTALGFELFSAYTVKKALPRFVAAVLFIALSWELTTFLVQLTNDVGRGVLGLVTSPFGNSIPTSLADVIQPGGGATLSAVAGGGVIIAGLVLGPALLGILLSYGFTALVALFIGIVVLTLRQVILLVLLLVAPLAILAWIFPNNDKPWKLWWGSFSKLLLMYPLIMLLVGMGRVFAGVTSVGSTGGILELLIKMTAYIAPYFFIPSTFKFAGGVFGNLAGMANDRGKGLFDRQKKRRAESAGSAYRDFKSGAVGSGIRGSASRGVGQRLGVGMKGRFGLGSQEKFSQARDQLERKAMVENVMKGPAWDAVNNNDDALHAATYGNASLAKTGLINRFGDTEEGRARADRAIKATQTSIGFGRPQQIAAAQQLVSTGTGYNDVNDMTQTLNRASGGNRNTASALAGFANAETKKVGRNDLAPGWGDLDKAVRSASGGYAMTDGADKDIMSSAELTEAGWNSGSLYGVANGKTPGLKNMTNHWQKQQEAAYASKDSGAIERVEIARAELKAMLPNAVGANAKVINESLNQMDRVEQSHDVNGTIDMPGLRGIQATARTKARVYERQDPNNITP